MDCSRRRGAPALVSSRSSINMECVSGGCQQQHFTRKMWAWVFVIPNSSQESESTAMLLFCHLSKSSCGEKEDVFLTIPEEGNDCRSNLFLSLSINDMMGGPSLPAASSLSPFFWHISPPHPSLAVVWQYLLTLLEFYIIPFSCCPGFSCLQLIDCLVNYAEI